MYSKEMPNTKKPPTGVEPLIAPGFNPGIQSDCEFQSNPKGVEHPRMKQILSLVVKRRISPKVNEILQFPKKTGQAVHPSE